MFMQLENAHRPVVGKGPKNKKSEKTSNSKILVTCDTRLDHAFLAGGGGSREAPGPSHFLKTKLSQER